MSDFEEGHEISEDDFRSGVREEEEWGGGRR